LVDPLRLRQIVLNLVQNAVKFTEQGHVHLIVDWNDGSDSKKEGELAIAVEDSGIGIPPEQAARLFESFYQADADPSRSYGGTGLGLTICQNLMNLMNGSIRVDSEPGRGSTFSIVLPAVACEASDEAALPSAVPLAASSVESAGDPHPGNTSVGGTRIDTDLKVLLAEDNAVNQKVAMWMLERLGLQADLVSHGEAAVEACRETAYDVILMDIQMPLMSGTDATREIRRESGSAEWPWIIALTAGALQENKAEAFAAGLNDYLSKPINVSLLEQKLQTACKARNQRLGFEPGSSG